MCNSKVIKFAYHPKVFTSWIVDSKFLNSSRMFSSHLKIIIRWMFYLQILYTVYSCVLIVWPWFQSILDGGVAWYEATIMLLVYASYIVCMK